MQETLCPSQQEVGILADFGHRRTPGAAERLLRTAHHVGFQGLHVERRKCHDYAVVLTGLKSIREGRALQREAGSVGLAVTLDCRSHPIEGGLAAVFGHRRRRAQALHLEAKAAAVGFQDLQVVQDRCNDWEVDLFGLKTPQQRQAFAAEARGAGFRVTFEPG